MSQNKLNYSEEFSFLYSNIRHKINIITNNLSLNIYLLIFDYPPIQYENIFKFSNQNSQKFFYDSIITSIKRKTIKFEKTNNKINISCQNINFALNLKDSSVNDLIKILFNKVKELENQNKIFEKKIQDLETKNLQLKDEIFQMQNSKTISLDCSFNLNKLIYKKVISNHKNQINYVIKFPSGKFATCSNDKSIIIYNENKEINLIIENAHEKKVTCICIFTENLLISSSMEIKIWEIKNFYFRKIQVLNFHNEYINKIIKLNDEYFASAGEDKNIIIYKYIPNLNKFEKFTILNGNKNGIDGMIYFDDLLISVSDNEVIFWKNFKIIKILENLYHYSCNGLIKLNKNYIALAEKENIFIININTFQVESAIKTTNGFIDCLLLLNDGTLISGGKDSFIERWNVLTREKIDFCEINEINILQFIEFDDNSIGYICEDSTDFFVIHH